MKKSSLLWLGACVLLSGMIPVEADISPMIRDEEVRDFLRQMQTYSSERDADKLAGMVAPDAKIEIPVEGELRHLNRETYRKQLKETFHEVEGYHYYPTVEAIFFKGNQATIYANVVERLKVSPEVTRTRNFRETCVLEKRDGKLLIIRRLGETAKESTPVGDVAEGESP